MAKHLNQHERGVLYRLHKAGKTNQEIAKLMARDPSTVGRELKRNSGGRGYRPQQAQRLAQERRLRCRRREKLQDSQLLQVLKDGLEKRWSPDQIASTLRKKHPHEPNLCISHEAIYQWIARQPDHKRWRACLRLTGRRRGPDNRGKIPRTVSIQGRPKIVDHRQRVGDWEGDTIVGKGRRSAVFTAVDRKTGFLQMIKVENLQAGTLRKRAKQKLGKLPERMRKTMTLDNGKEFGEHELLAEQLGLSVYFADPYSAWQRGTNENTNGLVRQFFPKGTNFTRVSDDEIARVEQLINERPRRRHGYQSPSQLIASYRRRTHCN